MSGPTLSALSGVIRQPAHGAWPAHGASPRPCTAGGRWHTHRAAGLLETGGGCGSKQLLVVLSLGSDPCAESGIPDFLRFFFLPFGGGTGH